VKGSPTISALMCLLIIPTAAVGLEVSSQVRLSPPEIVVLPSGRLYLRQTVEADVPAGESELALECPVAEADEQSVRLRVMEPEEGVSIAERYRRPEATGKLFWKLIATSPQHAVLQVRCCPKNVSVGVSYDARLRPAEGMLDLLARVTIQFTGYSDMHDVSARLPSGDTLVTNLTSGASTTQDLFALRDIPYCSRHVYDEKAYGKQVVHLVELAVPSRCRALGAGAVAFYSAESEAGKMLGKATMSVNRGDEPVELRVCTLPDIAVSGGMTKSEQQSVKTDVYKKLALYDLHEEYEYSFLNRGSLDIELVYRAHGEGDWRVEKSSHKCSRIDADTAEWVVPLARGRESILEYTTVQKTLTP